MRETLTVSLFSVIACKPSIPTYLQALNPTDQVFDFEELEYHYQVANRTEDAPSKGIVFLPFDLNAVLLMRNFVPGVDNGDDDDDDGDEVKENKPEKEEKIDDNLSTEMVGAVTAANNSPTIDNPYLRAAKIPKKVKFDNWTREFQFL